MEEEKLIRYFKGLSSAEEKEDIYRWVVASKDHEEQFYVAKARHVASLFDQTSQEVDVDSRWEVFQNRLHDKPTYGWSMLRYAAAFLVFVGLGYLAHLHLRVLDQREPTDLTTAQAAVPENAILLTLENGETQIISENDDRAIEDIGGYMIGKQQGTALIYLKDDSLDESKTEISYNTLKVPYGKQFTVVLSDGSHVTLNAGSSLRYPTRFVKNATRQVYLEGEGYFSVQKAAEQPFVVRCDDMDVQVLGTVFNVSSYAEDRHTITTLVEGKVRVHQQGTSVGSTGSAVLHPGQMAIWNKEKKDIHVRPADVQLQTAWMTGRMIFRHTSFPDILQRLERQYNVHITNKNMAMASEYFTATFDNKSIEQVLETFRKGYGLKYDIHGKDIYIHP